MYALLTSTTLDVCKVTSAPAGPSTAASCVCMRFAVPHALVPFPAPATPQNTHVTSTRPCCVTSQVAVWTFAVGGVGLAAWAISLVPLSLPGQAWGAFDGVQTLGSELAGQVGKSVECTAPRLCPV